MNFYTRSSLMASALLIFWSFLMLNLTLWVSYYKSNIILDFNMFTINSCFISFSIIIDWVSAAFSLIVCFISSCVMMFSSSYMSQDLFVARFIWIVMLFVLSMNFLIFIPNLVSLLLGWDGLGLVSFCLVIYYQNYKSLGAGLMTAFMNRLGDVGILLSIGWSFSQGHWLSSFMWDYPFYSLSIMMMLLASTTKSAQIPFSSWLPAAMAAPTPVSALVHSSTLVTAGVFLLIRFFYFLESFYLFKPLILIISVMTMLMAGLAANFEMDLKKIIALSTLSQLGVMMCSVGLGFPLLSLIHLFTHALFKALLFLCAGGIIHCHNGNQDLRKMGQLWLQLPVSSSCFNVANLALCGIPYFAGFYSKDLIFEMMIMNQMNLLTGLMIFFATCLTASYSIRLSLMIFWMEMKQSSFISANDEDIYIIIPILLLTMGAIFSGALLSWLYLSPLVVLMLNFFDKTAIMVITLLGAVLPFFLLKNLYYKKKNLTLDFFSYMWFLSTLSNNFISQKVMKGSLTVFKVVDSSWLEIFSGEGTFKTILFLSKLNQQSQGNLFSFLLSISIISISILPLILYLFY
uniref:NADH-ubiquinone oxidoreductase chain 5 n=1 Tax=Lepidozona coreanica TaxID=55527 RepID=A0A6G9DVF2_9MOLL|nr:NADH dehydrogenase subunit 5 [Lepidozona coreanica]QIP53383.1 NADH dehydrogenase subunit 5 [Lepidozona coreanica]